MNGEKQRVHIWLTEEQVKWLDEQAVKADLDRSYLIRQAVELFKSETEANGKLALVF